MKEAITIRMDTATYERLEALARTSSRSKSDLANEALKTYLHGDGGQMHAHVPVVVSTKDLIGDFWGEDDSDAFLAYLEEERSGYFQGGETHSP